MRWSPCSCSRWRRPAPAALAWRELNTPLPSAAEGAWLRIESGTPLRRVTADLAERGLLDQPWLLATYARLTGEATRVRAGEYQLGEGTTPLTLLAKLVNGDVYLHQITIVEGSRFAELLAALRSHPAVEATDLDGRCDHDRARRAGCPSGRAVLSRDLSVPVWDVGRRRATCSRTKRLRRNCRRRGATVAPTCCSRTTTRR